MSTEARHSSQRGTSLGFSGHPTGLAPLFLTELWERFSYYGMRALLTLFMVAPREAGGLALSVPEAAAIYGNYTMAVYMLALPGGFVADNHLGAKRAVMIGGSLIALGHYTLAFPATPSFYPGLILVALGTGLFKPSISALVGALYAKGDPRRDAGFSIFYMGINIGAFAAPIVTGFLAQSDTFRGWLVAAGLDARSSWHWGFAAAGVGMTLAMIAFMGRRKLLDGVGEEPMTTAPGRRQLTRLGLVAAGTLALLAVTVLSDREGLTWLRGLFVAGPLAAAAMLGRSHDPDRRRLAAIAALLIASMVFWAMFEQAGLSIALFADQLTRTDIAGLSFPSAWFQSLNALFVIALAPLFAWGWMRLGPRQPSEPVKFVLGLVLLALSFALMVPAAALTASGKVSPLWLVALFFVQTLGELCLSPVGLSTMTKLAPARLTGVALGVWFLGAAWGNKLAGIVGAGYTPDADGLQRFFLVQAGMVAAAALMLMVMVPWIKRLMAGTE